MKNNTKLYEKFKFSLTSDSLKVSLNTVLILQYLRK